MKKPTKASRAKASDALGKMMGKAIAARAAGAGASPMGRVPMGAPATPPMGMGMGMKKGGSAKKMAGGGSFRSSANGIASKGKTKGTQVKMARGGMKGC